MANDNGAAKAPALIEAAGIPAVAFVPERHSRLGAVRGKVSRSMNGYLRGVLLVDSPQPSSTWVGRPLPAYCAVPLALLTALGEFIPYVVPVIAAVPGILVALMQSPQTAFWALIVYIAVQQIEGHLLTPNIMKRETDLPQHLVIIALFAGGTLGGLLGALVAAPAAAQQRCC